MHASGTRRDTWEYAAVAPTIHPAVFNTITNRGAIEKAQKKK
jgi:hypothetical protein